MRIYYVKFVYDLCVKLQTETSGTQKPHHSSDRSTERFWKNSIVKLLWVCWITNALYV